MKGIAMKEPPPLDQQYGEYDFLLREGLEHSSIVKGLLKWQMKIFLFMFFPEYSLRPLIPLFCKRRSRGTFEQGSEVRGLNTLTYDDPWSCIMNSMVSSPSAFSILTFGWTSSPLVQSSPIPLILDVLLTSALVFKAMWALQIRSNLIHLGIITYLHMDPLCSNSSPGHFPDPTQGCSNLFTGWAVGSQYPTLGPSCLKYWLKLELVPQCAADRRSD